MTVDYADFTSCISDVELSKVLMIKHIFPSCLPRIRSPDVLAHFTERECRFCTCAEGALCLSNRSFHMAIQKRWHVYHLEISSASGTTLVVLGCVTRRTVYVPCLLVKLYQGAAWVRFGNLKRIDEFAQPFDGITASVSDKPYAPRAQHFLLTTRCSLTEHN
jgi:hypothetical protein